MKIGLVLEGGGMRGLYTAGVLDVLMTLDIPITHIVAVSAGALFGVNYASKQQGRAIRYNLTYAGDARYMGLKQLIKTGNIVSKDFAYYQVPMALDPFDQAAFARSGIHFYATVTNLLTGQAEYHPITDVFAQMEVLRASSALPLVSKTILIDGQPYLDGGIADPIPFDFMQSLGMDKIIVVLTRPLDYRKKTSSSLVYKGVYRKYPAFVDAWGQRSDRYNAVLDNLQMLEDQGQVMVVRPSQDLRLARLEKDPAKLKSMYELGVQDMSAQVANLHHYLDFA